MGDRVQLSFLFWPHHVFFCSKRECYSADSLMCKLGLWKCLIYDGLEFLVEDLSVSYKNEQVVSCHLNFQPTEYISRPVTMRICWLCWNLINILCKFCISSSVQVIWKQPKNGERLKLMDLQWRKKENWKVNVVQHTHMN